MIKILKKREGGKEGWEERDGGRERNKENWGRERNFFLEHLVHAIETVEFNINISIKYL